MKRICKIVLFIVLAMLVLSLCACTRNTPVSETLTENAITAATALEKSLSKECKTDAISTQITVVKTEIRAISKACESEKNEIEKDKLKWKLSFWVLAGVVFAYISKKVLN